MCVFSGGADAARTGIYFGRTKVEDQFAHVLVYGNSVMNLSQGPNCMIIHVPTRFIEPENLFEVPTTLFDDFRTAIEWNSPSMSYGAMRTAKSPLIGVTSYGIYSVAYTNQPTRLHEVQHLVPREKWVDIDPAMLAWYEHEVAPGWTTLFFFFNTGSQLQKAHPIALWYYPLKDMAGNFFLPGLDSHGGGVPSPSLLQGTVDVDHTLVFGTTVPGESLLYGFPVNYSTPLTGQAATLLPNRVFGVTYKGQLPNGDWTGPWRPELTPAVINLRQLPAGLR